MIITWVAKIERTYSIDLPLDRVRALLDAHSVGEGTDATDDRVYQADSDGIGEFFEALVALVADEGVMTDEDFDDTVEDVTYGDDEEDPEDEDDEDDDDEDTDPDDLVDVDALLIDA